MLGFFKEMLDTRKETSRQKAIVYDYHYFYVMEPLHQISIQQLQSNSAIPTLCSLQRAPGETIPASCAGRINSQSPSKEVENVFEHMKGYWNIWMLVVTFFVANVSICFERPANWIMKMVCTQTSFFGWFVWLVVTWVFALKHWLTRLTWKASDHFETISPWSSDTLDP